MHMGAALRALQYSALGSNRFTQLYRPGGELVLLEQ